MITHTKAGNIVDRHGPYPTVDNFDRGGSYVHRYATPLGNGRAIMQCDVVFDGALVPELSHEEGSPAPIETVRRHEEIVAL